MKKAALNALEKFLAHLPVDLKQHTANQLLGQINAQAHTLLETARPQYVLIGDYNGTIEWRLPCGKTYKAWEAEKLEQEGVL